MGAKKRRRKGLISASRGGVGCYKQARQWHSNLCPARQNRGLAHGLQSTRPKGDSPPEGLSLCLSNTRQNPCQSKKGDEHGQKNRFITVFSRNSKGFRRLSEFRFRPLRSSFSVSVHSKPPRNRERPTSCGLGNSTCASLHGSASPIFKTLALLAYPTSRGSLCPGQLGCRASASTGIRRSSKSPVSTIPNTHWCRGWASRGTVLAIGRP